MIPNILSLPKSFGIGNFQITFYALIILTAGLTALFYGMIRFKKMNLDPTRLENVFLVAFPSGLVGARIWYIICQFQTEFKYYFEQSFWTGLGSFIGIKNGHFEGIAGLAVEGGALLGIIVGKNFSDLYVELNGSPLMYGKFIQAIIDFLIVAFCIFVFTKVINKIKKKVDEKLKKEGKEPEKPKKSDDVILLEEIRDLLKEKSPKK
jgi:large conductance mechanosensitive channel protein